MLASLRSARRDLIVPPHFEAPPTPLSFTLGPAAVRETGLAHAQGLPLPFSPIRLGPTTAPTLHYRLGDGANPKAWNDLQQLTQYLKSTSGGAGSGQ